MRLIDKVVNGIQRWARSAVLGEDTFKGGQYNRLYMDWVTMGGFGPDDEMRTNLRKLRARARDLGRNNWCVKQYLTLLAVNVVGPNGFGMHSTLKDGNGKLIENVNGMIEAAWKRWSDKPMTTDGRLSFVDLEQLLIKTIARDGEVFVRVHRDFKRNKFGIAFEALDPDLVDETYTRRRSEGGNEIRMGIEVDDAGQPVAYHCWNTLDHLATPRERKRIPADEILHLFVPDRVNQSRGIPWISCVMADLKMLQGYFEAELVAARASAAKMGWFVRKDGQPSEAPTDDNTEIEANPGTIDFAPEGYEFQEWDPSHPTTAFGEFIKAILRCVASGFGVSYPTLTGDLAEVNYATMRGGLLIERDLYRTQQRWLAGRFNAWVYGEWIKSAVLTDQVALANYDWDMYSDACEWTPRGYPWINPQEDITAIVMAIQNRMESRTGALRKQGENFDKVLAELDAEEEAIRAKGMDPTIAKPAPGGASNDGSKENGKPKENGNGNGSSAKNRLADLGVGV